MTKHLKIPQRIIFVCSGSSCKKHGNKELIRSLKNRIKHKGLKGKLEVVRTKCTGRCKFAPVVSVQPDNRWFFQFSKKEARQISEGL